AVGRKHQESGMRHLRNVEQAERDREPDADGCVAAAEQHAEHHCVTQQVDRKHLLPLPGPSRGLPQSQIYLRLASNGATRSPVLRLSGNRITCVPCLRNWSMFLSFTPRNCASSVALCFHSPSSA